MASTPQSITDSDGRGDNVALIGELKRRRVFRVAGLYLLIAWIITEVSDVVFPALMLPDWTITFVILLLMMGFPVAMLLAWIFDIGPDGIQRTAPRASAEVALRKPGALLTYAALLIVAMLVLGAVLRFQGSSPGDASVGEGRRSRDHGR